MFALFCSTVFILLLYFYCMITAWSVFEAPLVKMCSLHGQVMERVDDGMPDVQLIGQMRGRCGMFLCNLPVT